MATARTKPADDKVTLRFDAQPHHVFEYGNGKTVNGGGAFTVDAKTAKQLLTFPEISVADAQPWPTSDDELEALAAALDVELPTVPYAGGVQTPTTADKIAALEAAGFTPATAAAAAESKKEE